MIPEVQALPPLAGLAAALAILTTGAYVAAVLVQVQSVADGTRILNRLLLDPIRSAAVLLRQEPTLTERPDVPLWVVAPSVYAATAAGALCVVPLGEWFAIADVRTGIVLFGAAEALAIIAIFLHGWSANSYPSLVGGFRFVALGLSYELLSMFVLIAAALPAESLQVSAIVQSQSETWNVVRQPLGLPLWLIVTLGVTFLGPMNVADGNDLSGGTALEASGRDLLLWRAARGGMLTVFCLMGTAIFLGGWHGPFLPGWLWIALKTLALMWLVTWLGGTLARVPVERAVAVLWTIGLPLAFFGLLLAGLEALA